MDSVLEGVDFLQYCPRYICGTTKIILQDTKQLKKDLGYCMGKKSSNILPELPNTTFSIVIHQGLNDKNVIVSTEQLQASNTDLRDWEMLTDFIYRNGDQREAYRLPMVFNGTME